MDASGSIRFGGFALNRARGCLEDGTGAERFLRPKSYRVLEVLSERRGQLVSKDELVRKAWPDVIVSDDSLAHCVSDIRRALGSEGAGLLRTVPRRGYMLVAEGAGSEEPAPAGLKPGVVRAGMLALALVVAATGVWSVLPGGVPDVAPDTTESALVRADALLEARDWRRREDNERARTLLEAVVGEDPDDAEAWASLGLTYWLEVQHLAWGGGRREMARALEMVERSVALGGSARSHRLLAEMRLLAPFQEMRSPLDALASARAAVTIDPADPDNMAVLAQVLALTGRAGEAVRTIERAPQPRSDPAPDWFRQVAGLGYLLTGRAGPGGPRNSVRSMAREPSPTHGGGRAGLFAASLAHAGRIDEAASVVQAAHGRRPEQSIAGVAQSFDGFADRAGLAVVLDGLRLAGMPG